jgi:hypothetical protein
VPARRRRIVTSPICLLLRGALSKLLRKCPGIANWKLNSSLMALQCTRLRTMSLDIPAAFFEKAQRFPTALGDAGNVRCWRPREREFDTGVSGAWSEEASTAWAVIDVLTGEVEALRLGMRSDTALQSHRPAKSAGTSLPGNPEWDPRRRGADLKCIVQLAVRNCIG